MMTPCPYDVTPAAPGRGKSLWITFTTVIARSFNDEAIPKASDETLRLPRLRLAMTVSYCLSLRGPRCIVGRSNLRGGIALKVYVKLTNGENRDRLLATEARIRASQ
jgi:hypothetical protein